MSSLEQLTHAPTETLSKTDVQEELYNCYRSSMDHGEEDYKDYSEVTN
jgi:hypothetical protein